MQYFSIYKTKIGQKSLEVDLFIDDQYLYVFSFSLNCAFCSSRWIFGAYLNHHIIGLPMLLAISHCDLASPINLQNKQIHLKMGQRKLSPKTVPTLWPMVNGYEWILLIAYGVIIDVKRAHNLKQYKSTYVFKLIHHSSFINRFGLHRRSPSKTSNQFTFTSFTICFRINHSVDIMVLKKYKLNVYRIRIHSQFYFYVSDVFCWKYFFYVENKIHVLYQNTAINYYIKISLYMEG